MGCLVCSSQNQESPVLPVDERTVHTQNNNQEQGSIGQSEAVQVVWQDNQIRNRNEQIENPLRHSEILSWIDLGLHKELMNANLITKNPLIESPAVQPEKNPLDKSEALSFDTIKVFLSESVTLMRDCVIAIDEDKQMKSLAHGIKYLTYCRLYRLSRKLSIENQIFNEDVVPEITNYLSHIPQEQNFDQNLKENLLKTGTAAINCEENEKIHIINAHNELLSLCLEHLNKETKQNLNGKQTRAFRDIMARTYVLNQAIPCFKERSSTQLHELIRKASETDYWINQLQSYHDVK